MWGILNTLNSSEVDEVTIDSAANWKPTKNLQPGIKVSIILHANDLLQFKIWSHSM